MATIYQIENKVEEIYSMKIIDISKKIAEEDVDNELINHLNFIKRSLN